MKKFEFNFYYLIFNLFENLNKNNKFCYILKFYQKIPIL